MAYRYNGAIRDAHLPWPDPSKPAPKPPRPPKPPVAKSKTGRRRQPPPPCGTTRAYSLHRYHGEPVDPACAKANAESCARQRARKKEQT